MVHSPLGYASHAQPTRAKLSDLVGKARAKYRVPAIAVAIISADEIRLEEIQGTRVFDHPTPVTLDDFFHIGSCSKSVLALMAAKLVEQKKIAWQTRFFDRFPELEAVANDAYHNITLEDLLLCEAGIKSYTEAASEPMPDGLDRQTFLRHLITQAPSAKRKDGRFRHLYSNASYTMAAAMLENVTGQTYEERVRGTLTDDLGLSVYIGWPNRLSPDQPWGHLVTRNRIEAQPPDHEYRLPDQLKPAGDLSMTPRDFATYAQRHLRGLNGKDSYLSREIYRHIHFGHVGFSLGVANGVLAGKQFSGFDGSAGTFFCRAILVPNSDFAFTIMMNAGSGTGRMRAIDWLSMKIVKQRFNWWWKFWL